MTPEQILQLSEARALRAKIQKLYAEAMELSRKAGAVARYTAAGYVATAHYDGRPTNRVERADEAASEAWAAYGKAFSAYERWKDEEFAENGMVSQRWWYFDRPEAKAANQAAGEFAQRAHRMMSQWSTLPLAQKLPAIERQFHALENAGDAKMASAIARKYVYQEQGRIRGNVAKLAASEKAARFNAEMCRVVPVCMRVALGDLWTKWITL